MMMGPDCAGVPSARCRAMAAGRGTVGMLKRKTRVVLMKLLSAPQSTKIDVEIFDVPRWRHAGSRVYHGLGEGSLWQDTSIKDEQPLLTG